MPKHAVNLSRSTLLTPARFAEVGKPTGGFVDPQGRWSALASEFERLYWPGRAIYEGHRLLWRLSLYSADHEERLGIFDAARYPINTVAFHPTEPVLAVGTGSYDGGYMFEGDLFLWNWRTGEVRRLLGESREVAACRFTEEGKLAVLLRPRDEEEYDVEEAFETYVGLVLGDLQPYSDLYPSGDGVDPRLQNLEPIDPASLGLSGPATYDEQVKTTQEFFDGLPEFRQRHRVWDVMWTGPSDLAVVHDRCLVERWNVDERHSASIEGEGHGIQLMRWGDQHVVHVHRRSNWKTKVEDESRLVSLDGEVLKQFDRSYTISVDANGRMLCRDTGSPGLDLGNKRKRCDLVLARDGAVTSERDLGHYDCFNHFVRIDQDEALWFLRGTPTSSHEGKKLCRMDPDGEVVEVFDWDPARGHLMNGCAVRVGDALIRAYGVYDPDPRVSEAYIEHIQLSGLRSWIRQGRGWRYRVDALVTDMAAIDGETLAYALTDGRLGVLDVASGTVVAEEHPKVEGAPTVVLSLSAQGQTLAAGTVCGNVLLFEL